jgi:hypothetical protein
MITQSLVEIGSGERSARNERNKIVADKTYKMMSIFISIGLLFKI